MNSLMIQRSTIGQSAFASFYKMVAGYRASCRAVCLAILFYETRRNYPTRLETRTKEFNWIASRRVLSLNSRGKAKAKSCQLFYISSAAQADYGYVQSFVCAHTLN